MTIIARPTEINSDHFQQIIELVVNGQQVKRDGLKERILRADWVAYNLQDNIVICTATIKNPNQTYIAKVFKSAMASSSDNYKKELGYIATHSDYENRGHCQNLLKEFFIKTSIQPIFATTRKPSMVHILTKMGFSVIGNIYNKDLKLLTFDGKK
jgi:hypothetical protein